MDGEGARLYGGRWNSPGKAVVYASGSLSLAALEVLVHVDADLVPTDLVALTVQVPDDLTLENIDEATLLANWHRFADSPACRAAGDAWIEAGSTAVLRAPAATVRLEYNYLINPAHPEARVITVVDQKPFEFDPRLLK